ncbi:hypothetical protein ACFQL4_16425 [Halosimplex aquaticum]
MEATSSASGRYRNTRFSLSKTPKKRLQVIPSAGTGTNARSGWLAPRSTGTASCAAAHSWISSWSRVVRHAPASLCSLMADPRSVEW